MAELNIRERQAGDVTVLDLDGRITINGGSLSVRANTRRLLEQGKKKILLNLRGVGLIDADGIGELISSYTTVVRGQGQIKLLNLTEKVTDLLVITKLFTVYDVYDNEAEALSEFK